MSSVVVKLLFFCSWLELELELRARAFPPGAITDQEFSFDKIAKQTFDQEKKVIIIICQKILFAKWTRSVSK